MPIEITPDKVIAWRPCDDWPAERVRSAFAGRESVTPIEVLRAGLEGVISSLDALWVVGNLPVEMFFILMKTEEYRLIYEKATREIKEREREREESRKRLLIYQCFITF